MKTITLGAGKLQVPVIALGCMRMNTLEEGQEKGYIEKCLELGINFFDHADIYGNGECERRFSQAFSLNSGVRENIILQSKCGIQPGIKYDSSKEYIISATEGILKRLNTEYLDILLLHRPDALMDPEEVAAAFDELERAGKVRNFGVSNHRPGQIELLKKCVKQEILVDQLQFSLPFSNMVAGGLEVNMVTEGSLDRDGSVLDYCRLKDIVVQAWSPFQSGNSAGFFIDNENGCYPELNNVLRDLADQYCVSKTTIAAAWLLRHPARIQIIAGTMNKKRLEEIVDAVTITLSREEWYRLYLAAGHILP
ncbi:MAG: aldo/keto reductase family oxidoreductase [Lachnospiraceae bacterium]|nr:aldo/keto reductase family oxidoreductase [Lachnospiraceae bacterium]